MFKKKFDIFFLFVLIRRFFFPLVSFCCLLYVCSLEKLPSEAHQDEVDSSPFLLTDNQDFNRCSEKKIQELVCIHVLYLFIIIIIVIIIGLHNQLHV